MVTTGTSAGYYPWSFAGTWDAGRSVPIRSRPASTRPTRQVHLVDLTGNGVTDAIRSGSRLDCFFSDPDAGWSQRPVDRASAAWRSSPTSRLPTRGSPGLT